MDEETIRTLATLVEKVSAMERRLARIEIAFIGIGVACAVVITNIVMKNSGFPT